MTPGETETCANGRAFAAIDLVLGYSEVNAIRQLDVRRSGNSAIR